MKIIDKKRINRILLINLKYLGDLVVCSPIYNSLKKYFPECEIDIIVRKGFSTLFDLDKNISKVIEFDLPAMRKLKGLERIKKELDFLKQIRRSKYDIVITFHPTDRLAAWSFLSGAMYRVGYQDQSFGYLFNLKINAIEESMNYYDYYLETIRILDIPVTKPQRNFNLNDKFVKKVNEYFLDSNIDSAKNVIALHPGASTIEKIWSPEKYADLIGKLEKKGFTVILLKGPNDTQIVSDITAKRKNVLIADTSENIGLLAAFISKIKLLICNDSASSHIAAAVGTKCIVVKSREKIHCWNIYSEEEGHFYIYGDLCEDCALDKCKGNRCLMDIPVKVVFDKTIEQIDAE